MSLKLVSKALSYFADRQTDRRQLSHNLSVWSVWTAQPSDSVYIIDTSFIDISMYSTFMLNFVSYTHIRVIYM